MKSDSQTAWTWLRLACTEPKYLAQGHIAFEADRCVPPSAYAARMLQQAYDIPEGRLDVVHNGVPREFLKYTHTPDALKDGPLVFFGRFADHKGVDVLVDALGRLGKDAPATLIIGRGNQKDDLHQQVRRLGLEDRVSFRPWMTHHELGATLEQAQMVALPSRQENFSLAILSAMAVGVPTISTRVGGTPEIIDDGRTGILVPAGEEDPLADAIASLQHNSEDARRLGEAGRTHVRNHLTWEVAAREFESLFETVLVERGLNVPTS